MRATIDFIGFYNYDNTLFDDFQVPSEINKQDLIDNILMETAELELIYADYDFLKYALNHFSRKMLNIWKKLYETTQYEYNAIHNYDKTEKIKVTFNENANSDRTKNRTALSSGDNTRTDNLTRKTEGTIIDTPTGTETTEEAVSAYDSSEYTNRDKTTHTAGIQTTQDTDNTETNTGTVNDVYENDIDEDETETIDDSRSGEHNTETTISGNIGVTTTQDMIAAERKIVQFNVIDKITTDIKNRFCILIY